MFFYMDTPLYRDTEGSRTVPDVPRGRLRAGVDAPVVLAPHEKYRTGFLLSGTTLQEMFGF